MHPDPTKFVITSFFVKDSASPLTFRTCQDVLEKCTSLKHYQNSTTIIENVKSTKTDKSTSDQITLTKAKYQEMTTDSKMGIIIIEITPNTQHLNNFVAIYFKDLNVIQQLTEQEFTINSVFENQQKYYFFLNQDPQVKTIIVHATAMNGEISSQGFRMDPRRQQATVKPIPSQNGTIMFFDKLTLPVYIKVVGVTQASFVLTTLSLPDPFKHDDSLEVFQNKDYTFVIKVGQSQVLKLLLNESQIWFNYHATGSAGFCKVETPSGQCIGTVPFIGNKVEYALVLTPNSTNYMRMMNTNSKLNIQVTVNFMSVQDRKNQKGNVCLEKTIGQLNTDVLIGETCMTFMLDKMQDIRALFLRTEMSQMVFGMELCGKDLVVESVVFQITKEQIIQNCGDSPVRELKVHLSPLLEKDKSMRLKYIVQYVNSTLYLPQGIAYSDTVRGKYGPLQRYYFRILNRVDTEVKIHFRKGSVSAYLKVVNQSQVDKTIITAESFDLSTTSNHFFSSDPSIKIEGQYIINKKCEVCVLVIQIFNNDNVVGEQIIYTIEILQGGSHELQQHEQVYAFLPKNTVAYYKYECKEKQRTIIFDVQDNNMKCAKMYLGNDEYPSSDNNLASSILGTLSGSCDRRMNFLSVEAIKDCPVSVSAQSSTFKLIKISSGIPVNINAMQPGDINYFAFPHFSTQTFKVYSIEQSGITKMYLTEIKENIIQGLQSNQMNLSQFAIRSQDMNSIQVTSKTTGYCQQCSYLLAIKAQTQIANAQILLVENNEKVLMVPDKVIYDELEEKETTELQYYKAPKGKVYVNMLKNDAIVSIHYNQKVIEKELSASSKDVNVMEYNFITNSSDYDWRPVQVKIFNKGPKVAVYSIHLTRDNDTYQIIKEGIPSRISEEEECVQGFFHSQKLILYVSSEEQDGDNLASLVYTFKVNNATALLTEPVIKSNNMELTYERSQMDLDNLPYLFCVSNMKKFKKALSILQSSLKLNLLAINTWVPLTKQSSFMLHPDKQVLLDVFTCSGQLSYSSSNSFQRLLEGKITAVKLDTTLDEEGSPQSQKNHAVYLFSFYDLLFVHISSPYAIVRWMDVDRSLERGIGYEKYSVGKIKWEFTTQSLKIKFDTVKSVVKTQTRVGKTDYRMYLSTKIQDVKSWANCQIYTKQGALEDLIILPDNTQHKVLEFSVKKQLLFDRFKEHLNNDNVNLYIIIVADSIIQVPIQMDSKSSTTYQDEQYRFMYTPLKLPMSSLNVFYPAQTKILYYVIAAAVGIITIILLIYIIIRKIVPIINRLRGGDIGLDEERDAAEKRSAEEKKEKDDHSRPTEQQIIRDLDM